MLYDVSDAGSGEVEGSGGETIWEGACCGGSGSEQPRRHQHKKNPTANNKRYVIGGSDFTEMFDSGFLVVGMGVTCPRWMKA